jgi:basic amino acid/polyamine antiporter, APA family
MAQQQRTLKRSLSLPLVLFYGLGDILGAGIYVLVGKVAGHAGMFTPFAFLAAFIVAIITALAYAELTSRYPFSAGEAIYVQEAIGIPVLSACVGLLIVFTGIVSVATIARGFAGYLQIFFDVPLSVVVSALIIALGVSAIWGIVESIRITAVFTAIEVFGLIFVLFSTSPALADLPALLPEMIPPLEWPAWQGILVGASLAFYAFIGFEDMANIAEEVRDPSHTMPRAIIVCVLLATLLYLGVAVVCILSVPANELARSEAPLALVYEQATGNEPILISLISLFAVVNGALVQIIMASRLCYGLSGKGWLPPLFKHVNQVTRTPIKGTVVITLLSLIMALWLPIETLARTTSGSIIIVFALIHLALCRIKTHKPAPSGVFLVPKWLPSTGFLLTTSFILLQITTFFSD